MNIEGQGPNLLEKFTFGKPAVDKSKEYDFVLGTVRPKGNVLQAQKNIDLKNYDIKESEKASRVPESALKKSVGDAYIERQRLITKRIVTNSFDTPISITYDFKAELKALAKKTIAVAFQENIINAAIKKEFGVEVNTKKVELLIPEVTPRLIASYPLVTTATPLSFEPEGILFFPTTIRILKGNLNAFNDVEKKSYVKNQSVKTENGIQYRVFFETYTKFKKDYEVKTKYYLWTDFEKLCFKGKTVEETIETLDQMIPMTIESDGKIMKWMFDHNFKDFSPTVNYVPKKSTLVLSNKGHDYFYLKNDTPNDIDIKYRCHFETTINDIKTLQRTRIEKQLINEVEMEVEIDNEFEKIWSKELFIPEIITANTPWLWDFCNTPEIINIMPNSTTNLKNLLQKASDTGLKDWYRFGVLYRRLKAISNKIKVMGSFTVDKLLETMRDIKSYNLEVAEFKSDTVTKNLKSEISKVYEQRQTVIDEIYNGTPIAVFNVENFLDSSQAFGEIASFFIGVNTKLNGLLGEIIPIYYDVDLYKKRIFLDLIAWENKSIILAGRSLIPKLNYELSKEIAEQNRIEKLILENVAAGNQVYDDTEEYKKAKKRREQLEKDIKDINNSLSLIEKIPIRNFESDEYKLNKNSLVAKIRAKDPNYQSSYLDLQNKLRQPIMSIFNPISNKLLGRKKMRMDLY